MDGWWCRLDHDEEMWVARGMCGTLDEDLKVQRTIKRVEFTAFLCFLAKITGPTTAHVDNKGIIDGFWRGRKDIGPTTEAAASAPTVKRNGARPRQPHT